MHEQNSDDCFYLLANVFTDCLNASLILVNEGMYSQEKKKIPIFKKFQTVQKLEEF